MEELKEKSFTEGKENFQQDREQEERYNPNRDLSDSELMKYLNIR